MTPKLSHMKLLSSELLARCNQQCELCGAQDHLEPYIVPPKTGQNVDETLAACPLCLSGILQPEIVSESHWRCLNEAIWSPVPAVQVVAFRILTALSKHKWAQDLKEMMYLDDAMQEWADNNGSGALVHKDSNGAVLQAGDSVVLIQDLDVKGANFTAKRGTVVRKISLVSDNNGQIEGKVNDQHIVILTKYVRKSN